MLHLAVAAQAGARHHDPPEAGKNGGLHRMSQLSFGRDDPPGHPWRTYKHRNYPLPLLDSDELVDAHSLANTRAGARGVKNRVLVQAN